MKILVSISIATSAGLFYPIASATDALYELLDILTSMDAPASDLDLPKKITQGGRGVSLKCEIKEVE